MVSGCCRVDEVHLRPPANVPIGGEALPRTRCSDWTDRESRISQDCLSWWGYLPIWMEIMRVVPVVARPPWDTSWLVTQLNTAGEGIWRVIKFIGKYLSNLRVIALCFKPLKVVLEARSTWWCIPHCDFVHGTGRHYTAASDLIFCACWPFYIQMNVALLLVFCIRNIISWGYDRRDLWAVRGAHDPATVPLTHLYLPLTRLTKPVPPKRFLMIARTYFYTACMPHSDILPRSFICQHWS